MVPPGSRSRARSVLSDPERNPASTTTVPVASAAMIRLRARNLGRVGAEPGGTSVSTAPARATFPISSACAAG